MSKKVTGEFTLVWKKAKGQTNITLDGKVLQVEASVCPKKGNKTCAPIAFVAGEDSAIFFCKLYTKLKELEDAEEEHNPVVTIKVTKPKIESEYTPEPRRRLCRKST